LRAATPLEQLAAHDDLVVERNATANPFATYCISHWGEEEIPWRFRAPEVAAVYRLFSAVFPREGRGSLVPGAAKRDPARTLEALLELVEADPDASDVDLAQRLEDRLGLEPEPVRTPELDRLAAVLRERRAAVQLGDYTIAGDVVARGGELEVHLSGSGGRLALLVTLQRCTPRSYATAGVFAVSHREDTAPDTPAQREAIRALVRLLERIRV